MKILYIAAEHVSGTLSLFRDEHRRRGNECRFVTLFPTRFRFPEDICLNLPFMPNKRWVRGLKRITHGLRGTSPNRVRFEHPPYWNPPFWERWLFSLRDTLLSSRLNAAIEKYSLDSYDIYHLDGGLELFRDVRLIRRLVSAEKKVVCFYHGTDLRNRGIVPEVDKLTHLRLTSEWDLLELDPRLEYLYLPIDTKRFKFADKTSQHPIRVCHAARNIYKGTKYIIQAVQELRKNIEIELVLLKNLPYSEALKLKSESDIFIDQLTNEGGWGYGMSSVEALVMGLPVVTNIPSQMSKNLIDPPFIQADPSNIKDVLAELIRDEDRRVELAEKGRKWVEEWHDIRRVGDALYGYYKREGWT